MTKENLITVIYIIVINIVKLLNYNNRIILISCEKLFSDNNWW